MKSGFVIVMHAQIMTIGLNIRVINEMPSSNLFALNMFITPQEEELENFKPDWHIIHAPSFKANPKKDGTRQHNFAVISFTHKMILIGGTAYTGEMKKGIFSILNYILPHNKKVLSMHCSANIGESGDVAIFFGLSGTGKTTLSADPERKLIGDDEHGWTDNGIFNFEGGCYAKCIDLSEEKEPEIFHAIRPGALVENVTFFKGTNEIDFSSKKITENTRVSYPLNFISVMLLNQVWAVHPKNIFFLTCDAYGVLPPISKLTPRAGYVPVFKRIYSKSCRYRNRGYRTKSYIQHLFRRTIFTLTSCNMRKCLAKK